MKKFLAVVLSISMLNFSLCHVGCAKTNFLSSPVSKEYRIEKQNKGNNVVVRGDDIPSIIINNENNARADAKAEAKATANSGGAGGLSKLILLAIKIGAAYFGMKYVCNMLKSGVKGLTELMTNLGDKLGNWGTTLLQQRAANVPNMGTSESEVEKLLKEKYALNPSPSPSPNPDEKLNDLGFKPDKTWRDLIDGFWFWGSK